MRTHGGNIYQKQNLLDFSANINPLGMPDAVRGAIIQAALDCVHYPDPHCTVLTETLSAFEQIPASKIVCGNGAADLIFRIAYAFRPRRALIPVPTFSEYAFALHEIGCRITEYPPDTSQDYQLDAGFADALSDQYDIVFLCTPNNPTGQLIQPELLHQIAEKCRKHNILLVCDECFLRFCSDAGSYSLRPHLYENGIILNAFTKLYSIPGLRLGYALCGSEQNAEKLRQTGQFWSVSVPAQAAGIAALQVQEWIPKTVQYVSKERAFLSEALRQFGIKVYDGAANFLLLKTPADFAEQMQQRGIMIRKCDDFRGLTNEHFRIAVRTHEENLALVSALREVYPWQKLL